MPRTRNRVKAVETASESDCAAGDPANYVEEPTLQTNAASFKTRLQRFQYASSSDPSPLASDVEKPRGSNSRRSVKRGLVEDIDPDLSIPSPSPSKRRRQSSQYAPPSRYAHLPELVDILKPGLICVFVGTNPGIRTATAGHAYAHPSNLFWKLLHSSGCTDVRLPPENDVDLPEWYAMGNTNIVERPSRNAAELSKAEMAAGTPRLEEKVRTYRPEAVCIVGKGIWEAIWRWRYKREIKRDEFRWGWQDDKERMGKSDDGWGGAAVFVTSSTSGSAASLRPAEKEEIWRPFGEWVKKRRQERYGTIGRIDKVKKQEDAGEGASTDES